MNRMLTLGVTVCFSGFAIGASAQDLGRWTQVADQLSNNGSQTGFAEFVNGVQALGKHCGNGNNPQPPSTPPLGDGRVPVPPRTTTPPVTPPGLVWVGDHWERVKAPVPPVVNPRPGHPNSGGPVVRDHRSPPPVIRDHRNNEPTVRDHRTHQVVRDHRGG